MTVEENKFLIVKKNVILTPHIIPVIVALDPEFEAANLIAYVTSGLRGPKDQLRIIRNELNERNLSQYYQDAFEDIGKKIQFEGEEVYAWQPGWSKLLSVGFIVNPPYPAKVLMDYYRPGSSENRKGKIIGATPHAYGTAFDVGGGPDGVTNEAQVIEKAKSKIPGLKGYLIERNNNAIHCDCQPTDLTRNV